MESIWGLKSWESLGKAIGEDTASAAVVTPGLKRPWRKTKVEACHHVARLEFLQESPWRHQQCGDASAVGWPRTTAAALVWSWPSSLRWAGCAMDDRAREVPESRPAGAQRIESSSQRSTAELYIAEVCFPLTVSWFFPLEGRKHLTYSWCSGESHFPMVSASPPAYRFLPSLPSVACGLGWVSQTNSFLLMLPLAVVFITAVYGN